MIETILLSEALQDPQWTKAIHKELDALIKNGTSQLVHLPSGKRPLSSKWVLKVKADHSHKAQLVVKGYEQREGVDYDETFAPVVKWSTIRAVIALAATLN